MNVQFSVFSFQDRLRDYNLYNNCALFNVSGQLEGLQCFVFVFQETCDQ